MRKKSRHGKASNEISDPSGRKKETRLSLYPCAGFRASGVSFFVSSPKILYEYRAVHHTRGTALAAVSTTIVSEGIDMTEDDGSSIKAGGEGRSLDLQKSAQI